MRRSGGWYRTTNLQGGSIENCHGMSKFWKQTTDSQSTVPASNCSFSNLTQHLWRSLSTPGVTRIVLSLPPGTPGLLLVMPTVTLLAWCLPVVPARLTLLTLPMCCHTTSSTSISRSPPPAPTFTQSPTWPGPRSWYQYMTMSEILARWSHCFSSSGIKQ